MEAAGIEPTPKNTGKTHVSKIGGAKSGAVGARNEFSGGRQGGAAGAAGAAGQPGHAIVNDLRLGRLVAAYDALDDEQQAELLAFAERLAAGMGTSSRTGTGTG